MTEHNTAEEIARDRKREFWLLPQALLALVVVAAVAITRELLLR